MVIIIGNLIVFLVVGVVVFKILRKIYEARLSAFKKVIRIMVVLAVVVGITYFCVLTIKDINRHFKYEGATIIINSNKPEGDKDSKSTPMNGVIDNKDSENDSMDSVKIKKTDEIKNLPDLKGHGNLCSLKNAMLKDDVLIGYVKDFMKEKDYEKKEQIMEKIIFRWAGSEDIDPDSRGGLFDARKLDVMEKFYAAEFTGRSGEDNPGSDDVLHLKIAYSKLFDRLYSELW